MANEVEKSSFPSFSARTWWGLRERFKKTLPTTEIDTDYIQTALGQSESSARVIIPQLKIIKLIDEKGIPTPLANDWRIDESYPDVCRKILEDLYPSTLRDNFDNTEPEKAERKNLEAWFIRNAKVGESAASSMASFYLLLLKADPSEQEKVSIKKPRKPISKEGREAKKPKVKAEKKTGEQPQQSKLLPFEPSLRVDVQIHIPKDATPEQIDQIFKSMAEHIYKIKK